MKTKLTLALLTIAASCFADDAFDYSKITNNTSILFTNASQFELRTHHEKFLTITNSEQIVIGNTVVVRVSDADWAALKAAYSYDSTNATWSRVSFHTNNFSFYRQQR